MSHQSERDMTWVTCSYLEEMLQNSFNDDSICVHNFNIEPGSSPGDGYTCQIIRIKCDCTINNKKELKSIIAKTAPIIEWGELSTEESNYSFMKESKMLSETLPLLYKELRAKIDTEPFFPHFYKTDVENKILFMEDLKADGYVLVERKVPLDLEHVKLVMDALAKMHASSYLFFIKNPDCKNNYLDNIFAKEDGGFLEKMTIGTKNCLLKSLHLWPISEEDRETFHRMDLYDIMAISNERKESSFNVLLHGDCWNNNMMFKYKNGKSIAVKLIDHQIPYYNSIGLDLTYFLFTSARNDVKLEHLEDALKTYYNTFVSITGDLEGFTLDTVRKEFIERLGFGFFVGCMFRAGNFVDTPIDLPAYFEGRESETNLQMFRNEEYIAESVELLPLYKKYGIFQ